MKNLLKVTLIAVAFVFAAGCASKPAPAPQEPVMTTAPVDAGFVKHKKKGKKHHKEKLGEVSTKQDTVK